MSVYQADLLLLSLLIQEFKQNESVQFMNHNVGKVTAFFKKCVHIGKHLEQFRYSFSHLLTERQGRVGRERGRVLSFIGCPPCPVCLYRLHSPSRHNPISSKKKKKKINSDFLLLSTPPALGMVTVMWQFNQITTSYSYLICRHLGCQTVP